MRFETGKSRTHLGQRGHDVSEAAGLGEGRALRADEHDVESLIGVDLDGDGVVGAELLGSTPVGFCAQA